MRKVKHVLLVLAVLWPFAIGRAFTNETFCENGFEFRMLRAGDTSSLVVTGYHPMPSVDYSQPLHIPASVVHDGKTYTVEKIWKNALRDLACLQYVIVDDGIQTINDNAFARCINLKSVYIPASVYGVAPGAFSSCYNIETLTVDPGNEYIDSRDSSNAIIDVDNDELLVACPSTRIPASVKSIGNMAFINCTTIEELVIPEGVESIGYDAFENCSSLKSVSLPESLKAISHSAFSGCSSLTAVRIPKNVSEISSNNIFSGCNSLSSITVDADNPYYYSSPECASIVRKADSMLTATCSRTVIGDDVRAIGSGSFDGTTIHSVQIPLSVTHIGTQTFDGCDEIDVLTVDSGNPRYISPMGSNAILTKDGKTLVVGCRTTVIPDGVEEIGPHAFSGRLSKYALYLPDGLKAIGYGAFCRCNSLREVILPPSIRHIGEYAFSDCTFLSSVYIQSSVKTIEGQTFSGCRNLSSVCLPEGLQVIAYCAFSGCASLTNINIPSSVTRIEWGAFRGCNNLRYVSLPPSVTTIGNEAFDNCPAFEKK